MIIEIVVYNLESALMAQRGGANRIELCDNPGEGGTTPSLGMIETVRKKTNLDLFVMIRPRGGDFHYSNEEFEVMKTDIVAAKRAGVDGVVLGILTASGRIDTNRCTELIQLARPLEVTCHRAFDMTRDLTLSLEECITCGFSRILTSGGKLKAIDGLDQITSLNVQSAGRIKIMAGSGVDERNVQPIVSQSKVSEIHFSATRFKESQMEFRNPYIAGMGGDQGNEFKLRTVDPERIKEIRRLAELAKSTVHH
jgi:copper homeostasis protein